ncbi:PREDICTED: general transcription factor 3C polypeptide 3 isoform X1 [Dinoponera quadriceps]|uniref:General transcription factor 3C polypeptide 3 isoform X1 n=1 Tax=Dinoponera quadriceps TaxID=609295 RepID=A0A6P3X1K2_DINQU|nr:PREDICTED: general transcription factor 3C polypeptide 3 isoform X1 [Dinoponera quadriceps]XP_014472188.1 PREDICTED: general transcription factor 3C polypeptide 3 isoform X1 [Dinoponera quadriceps]XP_014472196.1 PREDICTED: general transcription factor 3C polypeptide 3 isoform X1 [Dinoponera quadriceps]
MESDASEESVDADTPEKATMDVNSELIISDNSTVAPVIIEELDEDAISMMDVDMSEFVEAKALPIQEVEVENVIIPNFALTSSHNLNKDVVMDTDLDQDMLLTADEEDRLTKQFLNGELTFCEYSSKMDQDVEMEMTENNTVRRNAGTDRVTVQKLAEPKASKVTSGQQVRQRRKRRILPQVLQGLMGEANVRFAKGEVEIAEQMCMEIIRQVPSASEPFQTLAMIYENDQKKSLQFALIAAYLNPRDAEQWVRLANLSLENDDIKQAITCYSKAIQASPKCVELYDRRAQLQESNGDRKGQLRGYLKLIHQLDPGDQHIIKYAKELTQEYIKENNNEQALEAMEILFAKCPDLITLEEVNIITELLITLKQFKRCLDLLVKYTSIRIQYKEGADREVGNDRMRKLEKTEESGKLKEELPCQSDHRDTNDIEWCDVPDDVAVDLRAKTLVILIELNHVRLADEFLSRLYMREDPECSGDLFLDVAEALMSKNEFQRALNLLDPLVKSTRYNLAGVWLKHAECWAACNDLDKAVTSYEAVRELSPQHLGARLALAKLYIEKRRYDEAIQVLYQDPEYEILDPNAVYQRTVLLYKMERYEEYLSSGMLLLSRHCVRIRIKDDLNSLARPTGVRQRLESLRNNRRTFGENFEDENAPAFSNSAEPSKEDEFQLFLQMCEQAYKLKKHGFLQRICFTALTSKRFIKCNDHITFLCLISCIHNNDSFYGYNIVREFVRECPSSNWWNLLNIIIQKAEDLRHNRFIMRLLGREDVFTYLHIMHANNCLVSGTYKYALNSYISLFKVAPSALLALLIGVTQLQMACQKSPAKKNQLLIQALAFFKKYMQLRGDEGKQEAYYNTARAFHQIGLLSTAIHFYKLILEEDPGDLVKQNANLLDLRKEAAFNLHLIYLQSENQLLARMYLENYITI